MSISIQYISKINANNRNIVIFVHKLSQLKNIDFLQNIDFYLKDKNFIHKLNTEKHVLLSNSRLNNNHLSNVLISLISNPLDNNIKFGNLIHNLFITLKENNITFVFDNLIKNKFKNLISDIIFGYCIKNYKFDKYKLKNKNISNFNLILNLYNLKNFKELKYKINLLHSINFAKDLVSEPANILNPISFSDICLDLKKTGLKIKVLNKIQLEKIGMRSLLAVAQGSENEPRVVIFEWNIKNNIKPTILVGKGVTFDTGGISLKPSTGMEEMITDMGGSAIVTGCMLNAALNKSSQSIIGIIGLVENMPDGKAQRPGDIVKSLSGQTIEVLNTDAEGRLILADILTYVQKKYSPKQIIDFATLTGAIMIALGTHRAGLFSNNDKLSNKLKNAGDISGENVWRMPLGQEYDAEIDSLRADMKNIGSTRFGGSIQAAQFIKRFIENDTPWAHLDIAGVSWNMKASQNSFANLHSPGATAFGIRLIDQFLKGK